MQILLRGREHPDLNTLHLEACPHGRLALALSAGSDPHSPARQHKGRQDIPNEDAVLAISAGPQTLLAVADAHYGHEASELLLERLAARLHGQPLPQGKKPAKDSAPQAPGPHGAAGSSSTSPGATRPAIPGSASEPHSTSPGPTRPAIPGSASEAHSTSPGPTRPAIPAAVFELMDLLPELAVPPLAAAAPLRSETTLTIAVLDQDSGQVFGLAYGDSSASILAPGEVPRRISRPSRHYVHPEQPKTLDPRLASEFHARLPKGALLLLHTDGVDECCYRDPERSIGARELSQLFEEHGPAPAAFARALTELALAGVRGNPGGQDNIAIACARRSP
jgi:hypothetical protein